MFSARFIPRSHGRNKVVVRGTVQHVEPGIKRTFWLARWWLGPDEKLPTVTVRIDQEPYDQLYKLIVREVLRPSLGGSGPSQFPKIGWVDDSPVPNVGDRVWLTFAYAGEIENFFEGSPPLSLRNVEPISDEKEVRPDELVAIQPPIPALANISS